MQVRMKAAIGGYRNGVAWPEIGGTVDVPDHEANDLIIAGYAEPAGPSARVGESGTELQVEQPEEKAVPAERPNRVKRPSRKAAPQSDG